MAIDSKKITDEVEEVGSKKTYSLSFNEKVMTKFQENCKSRGRKFSHIIEKLMQEYNEGFEKDGKKK